MSRALRVLYSGALYHITSRGNKRDAIYLTSKDREIFLELLNDVYEKQHWIIHAYCLIDNHYHLMIETPLANLPVGMRYLNGVYTQRFNRTHKRVGHVFQGRYKSILVEKESYLLELSRYIILNPVRAGMVLHPEDWTWSSYLAMIGRVALPIWLKVDGLLSSFGNLREEAIKSYQLFISQGNQNFSIWQELKQQIYLGSDEFIIKVKNTFNKDEDCSEIPRCQRIPAPSSSIAEYVTQCSSRNLAIKRAYASGAFTMKQLGEYFGLHYSRISKIIRF